MSCDRSSWRQVKLSSIIFLINILPTWIRFCSLLCTITHSWAVRNNFLTTHRGFLIMPLFGLSLMEDDRYQSHSSLWLWNESVRFFCSGSENCSHFHFFLSLLPLSRVFLAPARQLNLELLRNNTRRECLRPVCHSYEVRKWINKWNYRLSGLTWTNWTVRALLPRSQQEKWEFKNVQLNPISCRNSPTPPEPRITILYSRIVEILADFQWKPLQPMKINEILCASYKIQLTQVVRHELQNLWDTLKFRSDESQVGWRADDDESPNQPQEISSTSFFMLPGRVPMSSQTRLCCVSYETFTGPNNTCCKRDSFSTCVFVSFFSTL